jgi:hypothetical protein
MSRPIIAVRAVDLHVSMHAWSITSITSISVDRPRCQPGLRMKPYLWLKRLSLYLWLHAAAQISSGRQARARSNLSPGEPAAVWRSTENSRAADSVKNILQYRHINGGIVQTRTTEAGERRVHIALSSSRRPRPSLLTSDLQ